MNPPLGASPLHRAAPHESAARHVTGTARYVDDLPKSAEMLHAALVTSQHAHGRLVLVETSKARSMPGVVAVLVADDIPGARLIGAIVHDEPVLAFDELSYIGQPIACVVADTAEHAREAAAGVVVEVERLPALLDLDAAVAAESWLGDSHVIARGDVDSAIRESAVVVAGVLRTPAQEHFYLETHASQVVPEEDGSFLVYSSTQNATEVQKLVAEVLGIGAHRVACEVLRLGGGFGGKESQAANFAVLAALGAHKTGRPVRIRLDRAEDLGMTGKRHPFLATWRAGFDADGMLQALEAKLVADGGFSFDLSIPICDRALFHVDNAYFIPALRFEGRVARTNLPSNTAFRGFGGPQGMLVIEAAIERAAEILRLDPVVVRRRNYYGPGRDVAPYGQTVVDPRIARMHDRLVEDCDYADRRADIEAFNRKNPWKKRGIALQPVKFGISFTNTLLNQAGALVLVYTDGSVQCNHGGIEMGQGLHTKMRAVCADVLGVSVDRVRVPNTSTAKVPNTSATAASSGSDLNGAAVREACLQIRERLVPVAADLLGCAPDDVRFADNRVFGPGGREIAFEEVAKTAWSRRISLSASGFYATPGIAYDRAAGRGTPFYYFSYGVAVVEVELNGLTGEHRLRAVDILHDVGDSLIPSIDVGQVEGAFVQGYGWLCMEEVRLGPDGTVLTRGPSTYKIPAAGDIPAHFRVRLLDDAAQPGTIGGSKAVGEPPFMLAIAALNAIRHAIAGFGGSSGVELALPASPESVLRAISAT